MLWPVAIVLDGVSIPLADVVADVAIQHGRKEITEEPASATCQLTILDVAPSLVAGFRVGASLVVTVADGAGPAVPRFTGRVTDAGLDVADLTVIAAGRLSVVRPYPVGLAAWPQETWSARVARVFADAGVSDLLVLHTDPEFDPLLAARDPATAGPTTLGDYAAFLAGMVGALVCDLPDGRILFQAIGARSLSAPFSLDPAAVQYAPAWSQVLPVGNIVTVRYQADQGASVTVRDDASVAVYGEQPATIDTAFVGEPDAATRGNQVLARGAFPHWMIGETPVLEGLTLEPGSPVRLTGMPPASPFDPWTAFLEGWAEQIQGDSWTMKLALSDPLASGLLLPWDSIPAADTWAGINQTVAWKDALTLDALEA